MFFSESVSPSRSSQRNQDNIIHICVYCYQDSDYELRTLPKRPFLVAIEGDYIIGAVLENWKLLPLLLQVGGDCEIVEIHKGNRQSYNISPDLVPFEERDPINDKFFKTYTAHNNLFAAKTRPMNIDTDLLHTFALGHYRSSH